MSPQALRPLGALGPSRPLRALLALTQRFLMNFGYNQNCHLIYSQANCDVLSDVKVYATGGDGAETQYCQFNYLVAQSKAHRFE